MSDRSELDPIVAGWMRDEATSVGSEPILAAVLARVEATGQERYVTQRLFGDQLGRSGRLRWTLLAAALIVVLLGTFALAGALLSEPPRVPRAVANGWIAFAANGEAGDDLRLTEVGRGIGMGDIYLARDGVAPRRVIGSGSAGEPHHSCPAFSPDGTMLAYSELDMASAPPSPAPQPAGSDEEEPPPHVGEPAPPAWSIVVVEVAPDGTPTAEVARLAVPGLGWCAEWSPDGRSFAYVINTSGERAELRVSTLDGVTARLGPAALYRDAFAWSPDGGTLAVLDGEGLWLVAPDGSAPRRQLASGSSAVEWSPDGKHLAVGEGESDVLTVLTVDGTRVPDIDMDIDVSELGNVAFSWSPDGTWIAWADAAGIVRSKPDGTQRERRDVDVPGLLDRDGTEPLYPSLPSVLGWSPDGSQVLLASGGLDSQGAIVAVPWAVDQPPVVLVKPTFALRGIDATWQGVHE